MHTLLRSPLTTSQWKDCVPTKLGARVALLDGRGGASAKITAAKCRGILDFRKASVLRPVEVVEFLEDFVLLAKFLGCSKSRRGQIRRNVDPIRPIRVNAMVMRHK